MQVKSINIHNFNLAKLILDTHKDSLLIQIQLFMALNYAFLELSSIFLPKKSQKFDIILDNSKTKILFYILKKNNFISKK